MSNRRNNKRGGSEGATFMPLEYSVPTASRGGRRRKQKGGATEEEKMSVMNSLTDLDTEKIEFLLEIIVELKKLDNKNLQKLLKEQEEETQRNIATQPTRNAANQQQAVNWEKVKSEQKVNNSSVFAPRNSSAESETQPIGGRRRRSNK